MSMGLIETIALAGVERPELATTNPRIQVGGARIPYTPRDLASIIVLLRAREPKSYLALEGASAGGFGFITQSLNIPLTVASRPDENLKPFFKGIKQGFDLISIDARGLTMDADTLWKYIVGGKEPWVKEFGKGAPTDFGIHKIKPGASIIVHFADPACKALWFKIRTRYNKTYQSDFVGMVKT